PTTPPRLPYTTLFRSHEVLTHGVVDPGTRGDQELRADPVGREHQHRALVAGRHAHHRAERAELAERERRARGPHQRGDPALCFVGGVEPHAGGGVAVGHPAPASSISKWTSSLNARTRARTAARVTCSSPCTPNASTA